MIARSQVDHERVFLPALYSSMAGSLTLILMALVIAGLIIEIPFSLSKPSPWGKQPFSRKFFVVTGLAFGGMVCLLFSAANAVLQPVGPRGGPPPAISPFQENLLFSIVVCAGVLGLRLWTHRRLGIFRFAWTFVFWIYLAAMLTTAWLRYGVITHLAGLYPE